MNVFLPFLSLQAQVVLLMSPNLILAVNAGSSSLRLSLFMILIDHTLNPNLEPVSLLVTSSLSNIGTHNAKFSYSLATSFHQKRYSDLSASVNDHSTAFEHFLQTLFADQDIIDSGYGRHNITHVCHRVVHGGDFTDPVIVEKHTYERLEALSDLAPLYMISLSL